MGVKTVHKFGRNDAVGTSFVPIAFSGVYKTPKAAVALEFVSASADDTAAGTGAREITIEGLDDNFRKVIQVIATNGQTEVAIPTSLTRLFRWYVSATGYYADDSGGSHAGELTIREVAGSAVWSKIDVADFPRSQSEIAIFSFADNEYGYIDNYSIHVESTKVVDVLLFQRPHADVIVAPYSAKRVVLEIGSAAGSTPSEIKKPLGPFHGPCDVGFMGKVSVNTVSIEVNFEISVYNKNR